MRLEQRDGSIVLILDMPGDRALVEQLYGWWGWTEIRQHRRPCSEQERPEVVRVELIAPAGRREDVLEILGRRKAGYHHRR